MSAPGWWPLLERRRLPDPWGCEAIGGAEAATLRLAPAIPWRTSSRLIGFVESRSERGRPEGVDPGIGTLGAGAGTGAETVAGAGGELLEAAADASSFGGLPPNMLGSPWKPFIHEPMPPWSSGLFAADAAFSAAFPNPPPHRSGGLSPVAGCLRFGAHGNLLNSALMFSSIDIPHPRNPR